MTKLDNHEIIEDFGYGIKTVTVVLPDGIQYEVTRQPIDNENAIPERIWVKKVEIGPGMSSIAQRRAAAREQEAQALAEVEEAKKQV